MVLKCIFIDFLFTFEGNDEQVLIHDVTTRQLLNVSLRDDAIYSISSHPNDANVFATASEDGKIHMTDLRLEKFDMKMIVFCRYTQQSIESNFQLLMKKIEDVM